MCGEVPLNSLRPFVRTLTLIFIHSSWFTIDRFIHKITIFLRNWRVEQKNPCFLVNWLAWALCSQPVFRLDAMLPVNLCISVPNPLLLYFFGSTIPFGRPSASLKRVPSFPGSASLCLLHLYLFCARYNFRRRSLSMLVLSHSDTHNLNRHIGWCGCHERSDQSRSSQGYMA